MFFASYHPCDLQLLLRFEFTVTVLYISIHRSGAGGGFLYDDQKNQSSELFLKSLSLYFLLPYHHLLLSQTVSNKGITKSQNDVHVTDKKVLAQ